MNVSRLCDVKGGMDAATHQRVAPVLKRRISPYAGMGFTSRDEWIGEQTVGALLEMASEFASRSTFTLGDADRKEWLIGDFLTWAAEEVEGAP